MKFLIPTEPDDAESILVKLSLEERGHQVRLLFTADLPTRQRNSVYINNGGYQWKSTDKYDTYSDHNYDVVWWKRPRKPYLQKDSVHPDDIKFVTQENILFYESIISNLAPNAWWINSKEAASRASSKLLQLNIARECGMTIPATLCSNDPKDIRQFLLKYEAEGVIYKPLCPAYWFEEEDVKIAGASRLSFLELPDNKLLQLSPGIYQKEIRKHYDIKVTCFGDYLVAAKSHGVVTSRGETSIEPHMLPLDLENRIRNFMRELGLVFACFEFIVTMDDQYVFLDVHEQGQFLWIEKCNPGFRMLDIFTNFLLGKTRKFRWEPQHYQHGIIDYMNDMDDMFLRNMRRHVELNSPGRLQD